MAAESVVEEPDEDSMAGRSSSFRRAQGNNCNLCTLDVSFLPNGGPAYLPAAAFPQQYYMCGGSNPRPLVYSGMTTQQPDPATTYTNAAFCPDDITDIEFDDLVGMSSRSNSHYGKVEYSDDEVVHHHQPIYSTVVPKTCRSSLHLLHPAEIYSTLV